MNKLLFSLLTFVSLSANAQHSWVFFTDKSDTINIYDAPVTEKYIQKLQEKNLQVVGVSKWLNAACVVGYPNHLTNETYVASVQKLGRYKVTQNQTCNTTENFSYGNSDWQLDMLHLDSFHRKGYTGKDVTVALFDAGFYKADTVYAFDSLWNQGRIKGYWDFLTNDTSIFWEYDGHGKYVLSIIGANWPDSMMGAAPHANYLLARTEDVNSETHLEEYAWVKALEWADSMGADIIHSSLGYSQFDTLEGDYTYQDMDGETTIITKATDIAYEKGIFVTNSAGNEGDDEWKYITAPCDGKHVLCVGAVDSNRKHAVFSSYGPSSDGRVKPEVMALGQGVTYVDNKGNLKTGSGTSFSGPLVAGMVACLKQAWPNMSNDRIFQAIIESADRFNNPDTAYGYGIPNVLVADSLLEVFSSAPVLNQPEISIFPNPVDNQLHVSSPQAMTQIEVLDIHGKQISLIEIDGQFDYTFVTSDLVDGVYFIRIYGKSYTVQSKFIKQP